VSAEDEVRERVLTYLAVRHRFEVRAKELIERRPLAGVEVGDQWLRDWRDWEAEFRAAKRPHLTHHAARRHTRGFDWPPASDPALAEIIDAKPTGSRAIVVVDALRSAYAGDKMVPVLMPVRSRYRLRRQADGLWLISSRQIYLESDEWWPDGL
jgi:hypothetical protein